MTDKEPPSDLSPEEAILQEISVKLLSSSEPRQVLDLIAYHAAKLVGAGKTSINLHEDGRLRTWAKYVEPGGYFEFLASKKVGAHALPPETHLHMYETLRSGRPRIVQSHTIHDLKERVVGAPVVERPEVFYIFEPLRSGDEVLGVAAINLTREQLEAITPRQRRTLEQLLSFAAVALSNARLFEQLRRAKADVERLIHSSLDGIVAFDLEGRCTIWNPGMERISGVSRKEVLGKRTLDLFPFLKEIGEDRCLHEALAGKTCISEGRPFVVPQTGRQGFFEARYSPLLNEAGEVTGGLAVIRDITERKRAEEEIRNLARFPAENPNPVLRVGKDYTILYANEASRPLLDAWRCRVGRPIPPEWREVVARVIATGRNERTHAECGPRTFSLTFTAVSGADYVNLYGLDITERKKAGEALRHSEERFRTLAAVAPAGIIFADQRGHLTYANERYCRIAGRSENDLRGWGWVEAVHPDDRERISSEWAQAAASGRPYTTYEYRFLHPDGSVIWAWANTAPLHDASGELLGHVAVVADITERKRAGEALRRSEERYALAQRAANIGSWDWNILTGGLSWSDAIEPMFGFAPGQFEHTYEAFLERVHPGDRQFLIDSVNACVEKGTDYDIEHRIIWPDGTVRWLSETGDVIRDEAGRALRMLGVVQDITERKRDEEATRAHAALMGAVFEGSQNPLVYLDRDFNFVQVNDAYARACERTREELIGRNHFDLYPSDAQALFERVRYTGEPYSVVARPFTFPDHPEWGETYWDWTLNPVKDAAGEAEGFVFSLVDVTGRVRHQQEIEEAYRRQQALLDSMAQAGEAVEVRPSGLPFLGEVPWGMHVVALYESPARLLDMIVSYLAEGLRGGELCLWVLSSISREEALAALEKAVPGVKDYLKRGQLFLGESRDWYLEEGRFDASRVLAAWKEKVRRGAEAGFDGVRVTGDTSFLAPEHFAPFMDYEARLHHELEDLRAIVLCTYQVRQWSAVQLIDVIQRHNCALIEDHGQWRLTESAEKVRTKERLEEALDYQRAVLGSLVEPVLSIDLEARIIYANPTAARTFGYSLEELRRMKICDLHDPGRGCDFNSDSCLLKQLEAGSTQLAEANVEFKARGGQSIYGHKTLSPLRDHHGNLIGAVAVIDDISTVRRLEGQAAYLAEEVQELSGQSSVVFVSQGMRRVVKQVELVARTDSTVLITGETGTGKELVARLIHDKSPRKNKPLVKVHCAALSPGLIESEFFGHEKGAFTGAIGRKIGRFELADGGTIFLDEMGDIPLETQIKLLRVIQEREFERVGGTRPIKVDVRIVAATNRDVEAAVEAGTFRRDLYYRLNVFPVRVPPLRERREAIPVLAAHFARGCAKTLGRPIEGISPESMRRLQDYAWPGNVRELRNVIERAVITSAGQVIQVDPLGRQAPPEEVAAEPLDLEETERRHILSVLEMTSWRVEGGGGAAELLNMNPSTLRSRLKKLGIAKPSDRPRGMARPAVNTRDSG